MKFLLSLALAPVLAFADCEATLTSSIKDYTWLLAPVLADAEVAKICTDTAVKDKFLADVDGIITACGGSTASLGPVLDLVKDVLCETEKDEAGKAQYCLPSLLAMVPFTSLISAKTADDLMAIDFTENLKLEANQKLICRTARCNTKIIRKAAKAIRKVGADIPMVMGIIQSAQSACIKVGDKHCWDKDTKFFLENGDVDTTAVCDGKKMLPCFRKIASVEFPMKAPKGLCKPDDKPKKKIGKIALKLAGLAFAYFEANKDDILEAINRDLGFNIPALLPDNMEVSVTASADEPPALLIDVTFMGEELLSVDIDLKALVKLFKELLKTGSIVSLPFLENMHIDSASLLGTTGLLADSMSMESDEFEEVVVVAPPDSDDTTATNDEASAGVRTSVGVSVVVLAAAAVAL